MNSSRDDTLALLHGRSLSRLPVFSGLPSLAAPALNAAGVSYSEAHTDAVKMATAAASTFEHFGFESAIVPFDLCVEAEALGCVIDFQTDVDAYLAPIVSQPLTLEQALVIPVDLTHAGRVPLVAEALRRLKAGVGREVIVGAWVPGPFTLAWQLFGSETWLGVLNESERVTVLLETLAKFLAHVARFYREAGADFITIHEMGGSPQAIGPATFRALVKPVLDRLIQAIPSPRVLSMCGDTNAIVAELASCAADALSVDQRNDLARTRQILDAPVMLFGNFDPVATLSQGDPESIAQSVKAIAASGANAIWPGCDLWPDIPEANFRVLMEAAHNLQFSTG